MGRAFTLGLLTIALVAGLLSDIDSFWKIGLAAVLGGVIVGGLMVWRGREPEESLESNPLGDARIDSSKIPIRGGVGAGILIAILLGGVLIELPEIRLLAALGILAGLVFGGFLVLWRRHQG